MEDQYDDMLFTMLKECKNLPVFFDCIFGFLRRRTDFYHIATEPESPVGMPPGLAEKVVRNAFFKWKPEEESQISIDKIPEVTQEVVVETDTNMENVSPVQEKCHVSNPGNSNKQTNFSSSECYNGAIYDNYTWSQNITDVDITIKVPKGLTTKDLQVKILAENISIKLKDGTVLLVGELCKKIKQTDVIWSLDNDKLDLHLDKCKQIWWDCLIKSEPKLDVQKLDCSRPFEELPEEAQAKIEELQWNQERKRLGLPTSEQMAMQEKLKKAWNAEGSPFSGPFDPNIVIMQ